MIFCGPKLYQPDPQEQVRALDQYQHILSALFPENNVICGPYLWHDDLHDNNIFVEPSNPGKITAIIDWQSCHISPLFNHNVDSTFLDYDGPEPEVLGLIEKPSLTGLSSEEKSVALRNHAHLNIFIAWRKLTQAKNPHLFEATEFRKTASILLSFSAYRIFEYGEAYSQALLLEIKDTWPASTPFPFTFSDAEAERIKARGDAAVAGTELMAQVKETMGELWPDKGLIEHARYDTCRAELELMKEELLEQLPGNEEGRAEYERYWPFD